MENWKFNKSRSLAPEGYEWYCNVPKNEKEEFSILEDYLIISEAYDMFDNFLEDDVGVYKR